MDSGRSLPDFSFPLEDYKIISHSSVISRSIGSAQLSNCRHATDLIDSPTTIHGESWRIAYGYLHT
jgi:hypothetical protein